MMNIHQCKSIGNLGNIIWELDELEEKYRSSTAYAKNRSEGNYEGGDWDRFRGLKIKLQAFLAEEIERISISDEYESYPQPGLKKLFGDKEE